MNTLSLKSNLRTRKVFIAPDEFLTTRELMQLLKIKHKQTVYRLINEGMPAIIVGKNFRFIKDEIIKFFKNRRNHKRTKRSFPKSKK